MTEDCCDLFGILCGVSPLISICGFDVELEHMRPFDEKDGCSLVRLRLMFERHQEPVLRPVLCYFDVCLTDVPSRRNIDLGKKGITRLRSRISVGIRETR